MPQEQTDFEQLIYETMTSVVEGEGITLTDAEKEYLALTAEELIATNEKMGEKIARELDVYMELEKQELEADEADPLKNQKGPSTEIDPDRFRKIIDAIKKHLEAFAAIDRIIENERVIREGRPKSSMPH